MGLDPEGASHHTIVKVCGLTRLEDARAAHDAGADWLGFIVLGESPRRIAPEAVRPIAAALEGTEIVVVMVAPSPQMALDLARLAGATRIQVHRASPTGWPRDFPLPVTFAIPVAEDGSITEALPAEHHLVLLDTADPERAGGTGRAFPWETARIVAATRSMLLAGGLDGDNVAAAIERVHPHGVDASSRLEVSPGIKDPGKVRRYVEAVRACDRRLRD